MINWDFSKVNLSLCISILALVVAFTGQSRPYSYADERLEPQIVIINSFKGLLYASCSTEIANVKDCKMFYENLC